MDCIGKEGCKNKVETRGYCRRHHREALRDGTLSRVEYHRISNASEEGKSGECSVCGPVKVRVRRINLKGINQIEFVCYNSIRRQEKSWVKNNIDQVRQNDRNRYPKRKAKGDYITDEQKRFGARLRKYALDKEEYNQLYQGQNGLCAICFSPHDPASGNSLCIDHDHQTGEVRGLLCRLCNSGLGHFRENVKILESAKEYLTNQRSTSPSPSFSTESPS